MSLHWAEIISYWSNWILIGTLIVGVIATYGIVVSGNVKEDALKSELAEQRVRAEGAAENAAKAKERAGVANADAARANERAVILEKDAVALRLEVTKAQLELERFRTPRQIPPKEVAPLLALLSSRPNQEYALSVGAGAEAEALLKGLDLILQAAHWVRVKPFGVLTTETSIGDVGVNILSGVHLRVGAGTSQDVIVLAKSFSQALNGIGVEARTAMDSNVDKPNVINIMVGIKP